MDQDGGDGLICWTLRVTKSSQITGLAVVPWSQSHQQRLYCIRTEKVERTKAMATLAEVNEK